MAANIGILGSGMVAQALATGFLARGHAVKFGTRDPSKLDSFIKKAGGAATAGSFSQAAAFGDIIVLAVRGNAATQVLTLAGQANLNGKTVIDTTNPIDENVPPEKGVLTFFTNLDRSLMESLQTAVPGARFVKGFSMIGAAHMVNPDFNGIRPTMFICGNDDPAKKQAAEIIASFGFEVEDLGSVEAARAIEPLCILWCIPGFRHNEWNHAIKLLKK